MSSRQLRIVVAGTIATVPWQGGWTWVLLQYVLGLRRLGHRVTFLDSVAPAALRPAGATLCESTNAAYFKSVVGRFGLAEMSSLLQADATHSTLGLSYDQVSHATSEADVVINVSGVLRDERLLERARRRVYLDLDPGFTQLWHAVQHIDMGFSNHTDFVTIGPAIGTPDCTVPTCGLSWIATWQPVVLEHWPAATDPHDGVYTTVANWRGYGSIHYKGLSYGQKVHAWRGLMALPALTTERFVVALAIHRDESVDVQALAANRWERVDPADVAASPEQYKAFIQRSKGEIGIAKSGYVVSRSGWVSDRSICYLASGRPVIAQETGFSTFLQCGDGLVAFETIDQARDGFERVSSDYPRHAHAARALAEEYFDSDTVLRRLLVKLKLS
jgi:hypothetical protein